MIRWPGLIVVPWIVNGSRSGPGEPLCGRAVSDHLLPGDGHIRIEIRTHGRHLLGPPAQLPQPVRDDLRHGFGAADEHAEHLDGGLHVGKRRPVGQPVVDQVVGDRVHALRRATARMRAMIGIRYSR